MRIANAVKFREGILAVWVKPKVEFWGEAGKGKKKGAVFAQR